MSDDDDSFPSPCDGNVEPARVVRESQSSPLIGSNQRHDDEVGLLSLCRINGGDAQAGPRRDVGLEQVDLGAVGRQHENAGFRGCRGDDVSCSRHLMPIERAAQLRLRASAVNEERPVLGGGLVSEGV